MVPLKPVDRVEILSVMDNSIDVLMGSTSVAKRAKRERDALAKPQLRAEHGVSMLVATYEGGNKDSFLFDTGVTLDGVLHNMDVLQVKGNELHAVVLSHGHTDHTRGLIGFIKRYGRPRVPIVLHPDAYLKRKNVQPDGHESEHIPPSRRDLEAEDVEIVEQRGPTMVIGGRALVTGQIPRTTPFEKGNPAQVAWIDDRWQPDPWIHDDQAIVVNVKDKGLVVLTGCGHAGVVNTLNCAREMTGVGHIHAVIGGFHLTGPGFEPIIAPTIEALKAFNPSVIVPQHCTGWKATHLIAQEFPSAFIPNSVGTTMVIGS
ncbi:MAG TPA: MBL fold metallo-hydrolase [Candidatus Binatia bacterium]|nr:MBL fold metallo-hydrolase [Candidatus Binatia bacterium]